MGSEEKSSDICSELRIKLNDVHEDSNRIVNLKLAIALTDTALYAGIVSQFYFVYRTIEESLRRLTEEDRIDEDFRVQSIYLSQMLRTEAFERDLEYFLGPEWRSEVKPSASAQAYCDRIREVADTKPILLVAYVHTMYLALTAGGQILKKVISKTLGLSGEDGLNICEFPDIKSREMRDLIVGRINSLELSQVEREEIVQEAFRVFAMNNSLAKDVKLSWQSYQRLAVVTLTVAAAVTSFVYILKKVLNSY